MAKNDNPHWHVATTSPGLSVPTIVVQTEKSAEKNYEDTVNLMVYLTGMRPTFRGSKITRFEDGSIVRWFQCYHDCVVVVKTSP